MLNTNFRLAPGYVTRNDAYLDKRYSVYSIWHDKSMSLNDTGFAVLSLLEKQAFNITDLNNILSHLGNPQVSVEELEELHHRGILTRTDTHPPRDTTAYLSLISPEPIAPLGQYEIPIASTPAKAEVHFTERCNGKCVYCAYSCNDMGMEEMPMEVWLRVFNEMEKMHMLSVVISGGEPTLYPYFKELFSVIRDKPIRFSVLTNGTLIDDELASLFAADNIHVSVSLDGAEAGYHDPFRGHSSFKKALAGLHKLAKHKVSFGLSTTLHKRNVNQVEKIVELGLQLGARSISFGIAEPIGRAEHTQDFLLTGDETIRAWARIDEIKSQYRDRLLIDSSKDVMFEEAKLSEDLDYVYCNAGTSRLTIASDGQVYPCVLCFRDPSFVVGSVRTRGLQDLWINGSWNLVRDALTLDHLQYCKSCSLATKCIIKNCRLSAYYHSGSFTAQSPLCPEIQPVDNKCHQGLFSIEGDV